MRIEDSEDREYQYYSDVSKEDMLKMLKTWFERHPKVDVAALSFEDIEYLWRTNCIYDAEDTGTMTLEEVKQLIRDLQKAGSPRPTCLLGGDDPEDDFWSWMASPAGRPFRERLARAARIVG